MTLRNIESRLRRFLKSGILIAFVAIAAASGPTPASAAPGTGSSQSSSSKSSRYDRNGYDREGFDRSGYDRKGYDRGGYDRKGFNREGCNREGHDRYGRECKNPNHHHQWNGVGIGHEDHGNGHGYGHVDCDDDDDGVVLTPITILNLTGDILVSSPGDSITLTADLIAGSEPINYQWMKRNSLGAFSAVPGANSLTLTLENTQENDSGEYWIVATNALGAVSSTNTRVIIESNIAIINTTGDNLTAAIGETLTLTAQLLAGDAPVTYQWMISTGPGTARAIPGATSINLVIVDAQESNTGQYWIVATNAKGSSTSTSTQVKVLQDGIPDV